MGSQKVRWRLRMHRHGRGLYYSLVAAIQPGDLTFFFSLLLLKEISETYSEHNDPVQVMFQAYIQ